MLKYLLLLFPILGIGVFIIGVRFRRRLKAKIATCARTPGTVIDSAPGTSGGFRTAPVYRPVAEYFVGGKRFTVTGDTGYQRRRKKGAKLTVMYERVSPTIAFIEEDYYLAANILLAIGVCFVLFGSFLVYELVL